MAITLTDVARLAGVSRSAVSRTFTEGASVSPKTREKVLDAAKALDYQPNILARGLTTSRTKLIGLVSNNFHNPIFLQVFDLFTRGLQDRGLRPLLVNLSDETDPENSIRMLGQYRVDGVIVASSTLSPAFSKAFKDAGFPVVSTFGRYSSAPNVHTVSVDNVACGRMAALTLVERGYQRVGFLGGPEEATSTMDRLEGFTSELENHPEVSIQCRFTSAYSFEAGRAGMAEELSGAPAEAYFCGDDVLSIGAMSAVTEAGLSVPDDLGIIGLNDMEIAAWQSINLTTIHQPIREIINSSIELIVSMVDEPDRYPEARLFPCHIVERGTLRIKK